MMRYTVVWSQQAINQLAQLWVDAEEDRQAIEQAGNAIDRELANNPTTKGTDVREGLRALDVPPLRVLFTIEEPDRLVKVLMVRLPSSIPPAQTNGETSPGSEQG